MADLVSGNLKDGKDAPSV